MISVVGGGLGEKSRLLGDMLQVASQAGAEIEMISFGTTRTNLSFLVDERSVDKVVKALHQRYFER